MRAIAALVFASVCSAGAANEQEIQRALIQRDQQSAEFANRLLEDLHASQVRDAGRPLDPDPEIARQLRPYERSRMARERELRLPPPVVLKLRPLDEPLPLPGGPRHGVDPVPAQGLGH